MFGLPTFAITLMASSITPKFDIPVDNIIGFWVLATYSKNFGTYDNRDQSNKKGFKYDYEGGLSQLSYRIDLKSNNLLSKKNITAILSLIGDSGELYNNSKMIMIGIEWYYSKATN